MLLDAPLRVALSNDNNVCTSTHILSSPSRPDIARYKLLCSRIENTGWYKVHFGLQVVTNEKGLLLIFSVSDDIENEEHNCKD